MRLLRQSRTAQGSFLLLEGSSDETFWRRRLHAACVPRPLGQKQHVLEAIRSVAAGPPLPGVLGIVDADLDRLLGQTPPSPDVLWMDAHDLESALLRLPGVLEKVLDHKGSDEKIREFEAQEGAVRGALVRRGLFLGRLRWLSALQGWNLPFGELDLDKVVDRKTWTVREDEVLRLLSLKAHRPDLTAERLAPLLQGLPPADPWEVCRGHDLTGLLAIGLRNRLGSLDASAASREAVEEALSLASDDLQVASLEISAAIRAWEVRSAPYRVLRDRT